MTRRIILATLAAVAAALFIANTAGAALTPWWCSVNPGLGAACKTVETANGVVQTGQAVGDTAGTAANAGKQSGRVVVNGVELGGTLAGKVADGLEWANTEASRIQVPSRTLRPGECVITTTGRYCMPTKASTPTAGAVPVGTCVVDSTGRKWCVTS